MSLSRVVEEVLELQLCTVTKQGRQKIITFTKNKTELWDKSLPVLRNPIKKKKYINITDYENKENELFVSGFSGLAKYSMLSEDKNNVYAIHSSVYNKLLRNRIIEEVDKSMNEIEIWIYNPKILTCTQIVDPLSLYLSLRNTQDERVESALEELIRGMEW